MKSFKSYISEEVLPTANVENGNFDIENDAVRGQINATLAAVTAQAAVTPYVLLRKVSKALAYFHVILPKRTFLEGTKGIEVYEVKQFGDRMGMNDQGEFINEVPNKYFLFFQYGVVHPFNVTYTKPNIDGMFRGIAKIVDQAELDRLLNAAEAVMAESCDDKVTMSQRKAGREEIQPETPSTKKAVADSEKELDEAHEKQEAGVKGTPESDRHVLHRRNPGHATEYHTISTTHRRGKALDRPDVKVGKPKYIKKIWDKLEEEQIDEISKRLVGRYIKKAHVSGLEAAAEGEKAYSRKDKAGLHRSNKTGEKREQGIERAVDKMTGHAKVHAKEEHLDELWEPITGIRKDVGSNRRKRKAVQMALGRKHKGEEGWNDRTNLQHSTLTMGRKLQKQGVVKEDNLDEGMAPVKKSYAMRKMKKKVSTQVKQGLGVEKGKDKTILVTNKGDPKAAGGGGVHRIPRDKYDPSKHNMASE